MTQTLAQQLLREHLDHCKRCQRGKPCAGGRLLEQEAVRQTKGARVVRRLRIANAGRTAERLAREWFGLEEA